MRFKTAFITGLAAGYVFGARAGRERYEQIARFAKSVSDNPSVKRSMNTVQQQASQLGTQAMQTIQERTGPRGQEWISKVTHKLPAGVSSKIGGRSGSEAGPTPVRSDGALT
jgi:hypothetical protein